MISITIMTYNERHHHTSSVLESGAVSLALAELRLHWQCIFNSTLHLNIRQVGRCMANRLVIDGQYRLVRLLYRYRIRKNLLKKVTWTTRAKVQKWKDIIYKHSWEGFFQVEKKKKINLGANSVVTSVCSRSAVARFGCSGLRAGLSPKTPTKKGGRHRGHRWS